MLMEAIGYNQHGQAIAKHDGKVFYIPFLLKGETAEVNITREEEKWGTAEIVKLITKSPNRAIPPIGFEKIGGYELMHMNREEQTSFKTQKVINDFKSNAKHDIVLSEMFIGDKQLRYRNKITLHDGGFHKVGSNEVIKLDDFLLTHIKPRTKKNGNMIFRQLDTLIVGRKRDDLYTSDTMLGNKYRVSIGAFYQVNKEVAVEAYKAMMKHVAKEDVVFDLYSGIGTITLTAADKAKMVYGVERNKISHNDAIHNKELNEKENVEFINSHVDEFLTTTDIKPDVVIVDPAREGLKKKVDEAILALEPKTIIYLSCNPATQAADFDRLKEKYEMVEARPFDMFPQTYHIENLIVLKRK